MIERFVIFTIFGGLFVKHIHCIDSLSPNNCNCSSLGYVNITDDGIPPVLLTPGDNSKNYCPGMNCSWKVYFTPKDNRSVLQIVRNAGFNYTEGLWSQMTIYNCNEACEVAYQETPNVSTCFNYVQKDAYTETMFTQEKEICINFTSFGKACVDCWWELQFQMIEVDHWEVRSAF